ncbi:hypothetical protein ACH5RR_012419 [Cinchona calisaya]|uniref:Uncharacterized protein n=1 Tax=Cinchona calisaya TaxID=153742 RepID=A0ABD3ADI2_9GENT
MAEKPALAVAGQRVEAFRWAARDSSGVLSPFKFSRRSTGDHDVQFKGLYCGMCDWDLNVVRNVLSFGQPIIQLCLGTRSCIEVLENYCPSLKIADGTASAPETL